MTQYSYLAGRLILMYAMALALFESADADLECNAGGILHDSNKCWADDINAKFTGAKLNSCIESTISHIPFASSQENIAATATAINGHSDYAGEPSIVTKVRICTVLCLHFF